MSDPSALRSLLDHMPESVAIYDASSRMIYANPATARHFGKSLAEMEGRRLWDLFPEAVGNPFYAAFCRVADGGGEETFDHYFPPFERWYANRLSRVGDLVHVVAREVTDEVRQRRRLQALARISEVLATGERGPSDVPQAIAQVLSEVLDVDCGLALLQPGGEWLEMAAQASPDPAAIELTRAVQRLPARGGHLGEALSRRAPLLAQAHAVEQAAREVEDLDMRAVLERYRPTSVLIAPLIVSVPGTSERREDAMGVLMLSRRQGGAPLTTDDRALVAEIAPGVALYLAHARKQAEATSLRHRLAAITDSNPALVSFVDRHQRYQYVNASYTRWFGGQRQDFQGREMSAVLGPEVWDSVEPHVRQALAGVPVHFRSWLDYPSGPRHVDVQYLPIRDAQGGVEGFAVVVLDMTAEAMLAEAEQRRRQEERLSTRRLESLLALTGRLAGAETAEQIARVVVDEGCSALEAALVGLWRLSPDGAALSLVRQRGFSEPQARAFARVSLSEPGPLTESVHSRRPLWIDSRAEYRRLFPELEAAHRPDPAPPLAFATLPLVIEGQPVGCLNFAFHDERRLSDEERTYLEVLASHAAEALRRAGLYASLRDALETQQAMIGASPAAILLLDPEGAVHSWNPAAERIFGWTAEEALGRFLPSVSERHRPEFLANLRYVLDDHVIAAQEARRMRKSGESFDAALFAAPVRLSDGRAMCLSMVLDISERKRIERGRQLVIEANAALTRSLDLEATLGEFVQLPVREFADLCLIDLLAEDGRLQRRVTRAGQLELALPREVAHDPRHGGASAAIATRQPQLLRDIDDATLLKLARDAEHLAAMRALQSRSAVSVPLLVGERVLGALSFTSTQRNFDEVDVAIVQQLASHLSTALENARLYQEARAARRDAEDASRAKDQFLAILGHELRNPLAPIVTAVHLMRLRAPDHLSHERAVIERQVAHLTRLIDDLLDISRITRGKIELRRERISVANVVSRAVELTSPLLEQRRHTLRVEVPHELALQGDPTRLVQVMANLLDNAAKYTEPGGHIEVVAARQGADVVLLVRDDGMGIDPEILPSIFQSFVQAPQSNARSSGGLGLGLAIVRSLVELHGGTVTAHSGGPRQGALLTVTLPAAPDLQPATAPERAAPLPAIAARRILVVDDNEDAAELLGAVLGAQGHETRIAFDGPSALRIAEEFLPEVAVLDLGLPVMDGYELAQRLRSSSSLPALQLIAVTGYGQDTDRARSAQAGFDRHLTKPVPVDELVRMVGNF